MVVVRGHRVWTAALFAWCAVASWAAPDLQQTLSGGGAHAGAGAMILNGIITDYGLPNVARSGTANDQLGVGFYPSLVGLIADGYNAAAEIWLEVTLSFDHACVRTAAWLRGGDPPEPGAGQANRIRKESKSGLNLELKNS